MQKKVWGTAHNESIFTQEKPKRFNIPLESLQLQGGSSSLFSSNWKEPDVTFSQLHQELLIYSKWYWGGSTAPELNLASAITLFLFICAWEINPRLLFPFFNNRTSHRSPYKTIHKVEEEAEGFICQELKGRPCQEGGFWLFPLFKNEREKILLSRE